jgi:hypothetical protein
MHLLVALRHEPGRGGHESRLIFRRQPEIGLDVGHAIAQWIAVRQLA